MSEPEPKPERPRWGLRTFAFLALAAAGVLIATAREQYGLFTLTAVVVGFVGAAVCSVRGLMTVRDYDWRKPRRRW